MNDDGTSDQYIITPESVILTNPYVIAPPVVQSANTSRPTAVPQRLNNTTRGQFSQQTITYLDLFVFIFCVAVITMSIIGKISQDYSEILRDLRRLIEQNNILRKAS